MFDIEKRTLEELLARYEFEPQLRDIYVEGEFDSDLLTASLAENINEPFIIFSTAPMITTPAPKPNNNSNTLSGNNCFFIIFFKIFYLDFLENRHLLQGNFGQF